jgi:hypothetical protein
MAKHNALRFRQIHLDFHTSIHVPDVGRDFDADEFARTMADAHVDSVTVFAKCHHGLLYYQTDHPARHPGLKKGLDLLAEQVEALHRRGIRAPVYISVQCDEFAADTHPEWIALRPDNTRVAPQPLQRPHFSWQILDMSSPYQEYLIEQTAEVLKKFRPVDGVFFDMCWDQPSVSKWAIDGMRKLKLDPTKEADRGRYAHHVALSYMKRLHRQVKQSSPDASVYFNSRPLHNLAEEIGYQSQVEIEALPTGGWGYMYFPKNVRFVRTFGQPYMGMTARFHKSWADFGGLKPYAALEYETSQMIAHGARCSVGDQLHPRGTLDPAAYQLIGRVYQRVKDREPWLVDASPLTQVGVLQIETYHSKATVGAPEGVVRMLQQLRVQFDIIPADRRFDGYDLLILTDEARLDEPTAKKIDAFVASGGKLIASGTSGLDADASRSLLKCLPISPRGLREGQKLEQTTSGTSGGSGPAAVIAPAATYVRFEPPLADDIPETDHVFYEPPVLVEPTRGSKVLARVVEPYFDRTWEHFSSHAQTPPAQVSRFAAVVASERVGYIAYPVFGMHARHGNETYRLLVRNLLARLLPDRLLHVGGPSGLETSVMRQPKATGRPARTIIHLLYYPIERRATSLDLVEDIVPLFEVPVSLKHVGKPKRVYLAPDGTELAFEHRAGRVDVTVPRIDGHAMIVVE